MLNACTITVSEPGVVPLTPPLENTVQLKVVPGIVLVRAIIVVSPEHKVAVIGFAVATGLGFTVTTAVIWLPVQPLAVTEIEYVAVPGTVPVAVNTWDMVGPVPELPPLTPDWATVQVNMVPEVKLLRAMEAVVPEQIVGADGVAVAVEPGSGLIVTVSVMGWPVQPFATGVMV